MNSNILRLQVVANRLESGGTGAKVDSNIQTSDRHYGIMQLACQGVEALSLPFAESGMTAGSDLIFMNEKRGPSELAGIEAGRFLRVARYSSSW
jgi:hypothetical protein